jgi:hypothetical protein
MTDVASQSQGAGSANPSGIAREKYWEELTDAQKIDRLREVVASLSRDNETLSKGLAELVRHQHGPDGSILTPLKHHDSNDNITGYSRSRTWGIRTKRERGE